MVKFVSALRSNASRTTKLILSSNLFHLLFNRLNLGGLIADIKYLIISLVMNK